MALLAFLLAPLVFASSIPQAALRYLRQSPTAMELLQSVGSTPVKLRSGRVSKTDFIATRLQGAQEPQHWQTVLTLSDRSSSLDQAIDLVHELTHVMGPRLNPYDPELSLDRYVRMGIEGEGGEGHAIATECTVAKELLKHVSPPDANRLKQRCSLVWREQARGAFWYRVLYYVGADIAEFGPMLRTLPLRSIAAPLISAAAQTPYPIALAKEYIEFTGTLCDRLQSRNRNSLSPVDQGILKNRCQDVRQRSRFAAR
jgi:hypothetical protein